MAQTLGALLARQAGDITGRAHERAQLRRVLEADYLRWAVPLTDLAALSALLLDATRVYMEMRPELRRVYARAADLIGADPSCATTIGYLPLEGVAETVCMDFGPASVEGWLAELGVRHRLASSEEEPDRPPWRRRSWRTCAAGRARRSSAPRCCATCGATSGRAARTSSRSSSRRCAASSAGTATSPPCAASATATGGPRAPC